MSLVKKFQKNLRYIMSRKEAREGFGKLLEILAESSFENINEKIEKGCMILHYAAQLSDERAIKLLIEHGAEIDAKNDRGETPLHLAAFLGNRKNVKALIEKGAEVNAKSNNKAVPLHLACLAGRKGTIEELMKARRRY